jgi:hypothetical protein
MDEPAPLLQPGIDRIPRHVDISRRFRFGVAGQVTDGVGGEGVAERVIAAVHHQRPLGVDDRLTVADGPNASRMRLDEDEIVRQRG